MIQQFYRSLIELTNGRFTSSLLQKFARSGASRILVNPFSKFYKIDIHEMEQPLHEFSTLHDLFIRKLKEGVRPIDNESKSVVSPVDGVLEDIGEISSDLTLTVKGKSYSLFDMLGSKEKAKEYINGKYILLYLSPSHYHRIHSPFSGQVVDQWTLGEKSYPVNKYGLKYGKEVLSKNYRNITEVKHEFGLAAIVKVGAMFVNSIETIFENEQLEKGKEIAYFTFGSTVILLFAKDTFVSANDLPVPKEVRVGEKIGYLKDRV